MLLHSFGVETVFSRARIPAAICVSVAALIISLGAAVPAANAADLRVSTGGADTGNCQVDPCATIPYAVGQAVDGDTIEVGDGEFTGGVTVSGVDDLTIRGAGRTGTNATTVKAPATPLASCDPDTGWTGVLCFFDSKVDVENLVVDGDGRGNSNNRFSGILYARSGGTVSDVEVTNVRSTPFSGAQRGHAISQLNSDGVLRTLTIEDSLLHDFQKSAVQAAYTGGSGLTLNVVNTEVVGSGPQSTIAQNGITALNGTEMNVSGSTISDLAYTGAGTESDAGTGIYGYGVGNSQLTGNSLSNVQRGIYTFGQNGDESFQFSGNAVDGQVATPGGVDRVSAIVAQLGDYEITDNDLAMTPADSNPVQAGLWLRNGVADPAITANRIVGNGVGIDNDTGSPINAEDNWWGCNGGPGAAGCDAVSGDVDAVPNAVLSVNATPDRLPANGTAKVTAGVDTNSAGEAVSLPVLEGRPVAFGADQGSVTPASGTIDGGSATAQYTSPTAIGSANVSATLDGEVGSAGVFVGSAPTVSSAGLSGSGLAGEPLTCAAEGVGGLPEPSPVVAWLRDGTEIAGQSGSTFTPADSDVGSQISCRVSVENEFGEASAESSAVTVTRRSQTPPVKPPVVKPKTKVTVPRSGKVVIVAVKCPSGKCRIKAPKRVKVKIRGKVYVVKVKAPARVAQGQTAQVRLVLPPRARRAIRGTRTKARVKVVITSSNGKRKVVNRAFVLRGRPR